MGLFDGFFSGSGADGRTVHYRQPDTRPQLFRIVLKDNVWKLILLNLIYGIFAIPLVLWCGICLTQVFGIIRTLSMDTTPMLLGTLYTMALGMIPCMLLLGPANAGIALVTRDLARDQVTLLWLDFWQGLKKNWKQALPVGLISAVLPLITYWYVAFLWTNPQELGIAVIPAVICLIALLLWLMASPTAYVMLVTYDLKFPAIIKNAVIMTIAHLLTSLGVLVLRLVIPAVCVLVILFISTPAGLLLLCVYLILWGAAFPWLLQSSYANRLCEEFLNPQLGEPTRIGLRPK